MAFQLLFVIWWSEVTHPSYRRLKHMANPVVLYKTAVPPRDGDWLSYAQRIIHNG